MAKDAGIDAFALNIGVDDYTDDQLTYAYQSAASNGMSVFISFDFNWYHIDQVSEVGAKIAKFASSDAQLKIDGKAFVSSFAGDNLDVKAVAAAAGTDLFFAPNFKPGNIGAADALLNWMAWPSNGNNKAPDGAGNVSVSSGDTAYTGALAGKSYVAPVSPWFSTHYGPEVSYSKNWVFPGDLLWYERWNEILELQPQYIEIITWNDYGESHYVGPLSSPHVDDGNSKWTNDMPHGGWLEIAKPYIAAFKSSQKAIAPPEEDKLVYWYRPATKQAQCDATDNCEKPSPSPSENYFIGQPNGAQTVEDSVFVVALLKSEGTVTITSGGNSKDFSAQAGANAFSAPMGTGKQSFSLTRGGSAVLSGDSPKEISDSCVCGIYNFNAFVGTLPAGPPDALSGDGFKQFSEGLQVPCQPQPSLGASPQGGGAPPAGASPPLSSTAIVSSISTTAPLSTGAPVPPPVPYI